MTIENQIKVVATLKSGKAKIADPKNWTTDEYARDKNGRDVSCTSAEATCFCSVGALANVMNVHSEHENRVQWECIKQLNACSDGDTIYDYNDSHTHAEVMEVWDRAIQKAEDKLVVMNLERLITAVEAEPEQNFNLSSFKIDKTDDTGNVCGTLFCTVGLACTLPEFQLQEFKLIQQGQRYKSYHVEVNGEHIGNNPVDTDKAFGERAFARLFAARGEGVLDKEHPAVVGSDAYNDVLIDSSTSDKELALWRLTKQLAIYKEKVK